MEAYRKTHQNEPSVEEIAAEFGLDTSEVVFIMDSTKIPVSLFEKINDSDDKSLCLMDKIPSQTKDEDLIDRVILKAVIKELTQREKKIIIMRYFRDMTQSDIAKQLGVSQVSGFQDLKTKYLKKSKRNFPFRSPKDSFFYLKIEKIRQLYNIITEIVSCNLFFYFSLKSNLEEKINQEVFAMKTEPFAEFEKNIDCREIRYNDKSPKQTRRRT